MSPEEVLAIRLRAHVLGEVGLDPFDDPQARRRILDAAARAKATLEKDGHAAVTLPALITTGDGAYHLAVTLFTSDMKEGDS